MKAYFQVGSTNALNWRKSQHCTSDHCVEVAAGAGNVHVRDSGNSEGLSLAYHVMNWRAFVRGVGKGHFERRG